MRGTFRVLTGGPRGLGAGLDGPAGALRAAFANPALRRVQLAWTATMVGENVAAVALVVLAYQAGGATAVGLVGVAQMVPAALTGPVAALFGDRYRRELVVAAADALRSLVALATAAAAATSAPLVTVFVLAGVLSVVSGAFYPAQTALVPLLAASTAEVTASAAASSLLRSSASLVAPAAAGAALLVLPVSALLVASGIAFAAAALLARALPRTDAVRAAPAMAGAWSAVTTGARAAVGDTAARRVLGVFLVHSAVRGAVGVLLVVVPLELLGTGSAGIGFLSAVLGLGSVLGALATASLAGRRGLAGPISVGLALTGTSLVVAAALATAPVVVLAVTAWGAGFALVSVSGTALLVRAVRDDVLARVLGMLSTVRAVGMALGAGLTPGLLTAVDLRWTIAVVGAVLLTLLLAVHRRLQAVDASSTLPEVELALLQGTTVFSPLPPVALERLAGQLRLVVVPAGTAVVTEGDEGDCAYVLAEGELLVEAAEVGGVVDRMGPGEVFGEMALLHGARRNATVRAGTDCRVYRLSRTEFLAAVTGSPSSSVQTSALVASRLEHRREVAGGAVAGGAVAGGAVGTARAGRPTEG